MNLGKNMEELEVGVTHPGTTLRRIYLEDTQLNSYGLKRLKGTTGASHHLVWCLSVGEMGGQQTHFYGHKPEDCFKKAEIWKQTQNQPTPQ